MRYLCFNPLLRGNAFAFSCLDFARERRGACTPEDQVFTVEAFKTTPPPPSRHKIKEERMRATRVILYCLVLLASAAAIAQTTASLTGTSTSQGKGLPGVTVTISSPNLQGTRSTVTGENGGYQFSALPPGEYRVQF